jgi:tetratricopeptide (TPR) repeat protein
MKNSFARCWTFVLIALHFGIATPSGNAGLFSSKETREYSKHRDAAYAALKKQQSASALKSFLAGHAVLQAVEKKDRYFEESLKNLGSFYARRGVWYQAEPYFRERLKRVEARRGTNHMETAVALFSHGQSLQQLYRYKSAETELRRAEHTARWKLGRHSVSAGYCKALLGRLYLCMNRNEEAAEYLGQGLTQMGKFKRTTRFVDDGISHRRQEKDSVFHPDHEDGVAVRIDYATALIRLGRPTEAAVPLAEARTLLVGKLKYALPDYYIQRQLGRAAEAIGDLAGAEKLYYEAAASTHANAAATEQQKIDANKMLFGFHIRHGQESKASSQEGILFLKRVPDNEMDGIIQLNELLGAARRFAPKGSQP